MKAWTESEVKELFGEYRIHNITVDGNVVRSFEFEGFGKAGECEEHTEGWEVSFTALDNTRTVRMVYRTLGGCKTFLDGV